MTREQLSAALASVERALNNRTVIVRVIIGADGKEVGRIVRSVQQPRDSQPRDPHHKKR